MKKYSGHETNLDDSKYNRSERIFYWEAWRVLSSECETTKLAENYIKEICKKLYKQKGGDYGKNDFFDKNFQVIVEDKPQINAALTYKEETLDKRNIIHISKGLIANLQNEAQLAFVLAHELGHFEVHESDNKDKNGVKVTRHEHETRADFLAFQTILQAGYNPDEAVKFFEMIKVCPPDITSAFELANNEHGSTETRIANIKDYKSAAEEKGIVFSNYTGENQFKNFQKEFITSAKNDFYISYLEERICQEYEKETGEKVSSSRNIPTAFRWKFCESIIDHDSDLLLTPERNKEFARIFCENIKELSKEDAQEANRILKKIYAYEERKNTGYRICEGKLTSECVERLPIRDKDGNFYIDPYGLIAYDIRHLDEIISNPENTRKRLLNDAYNEAYSLGQIKRDEHFKYPEFSVDNLKVGDKVPWAEMVKILNTDELVSIKNKANLEAFLGRLNIKYDYYEHVYGHSLGYPKGKENSIYVDADGIVLSTDAVEVAELRRTCQEKAKLDIDERKRQMALDFHDKLAMMKETEQGSVEYNALKQNAAEIFKDSKKAFVELDNTYDFLLKPNDIEINKEDRERPFAQFFSEELQRSFGSYTVYPSNAKYATLFYPQYVEVVLETELENISNVGDSTRLPKVEETMKFVNKLYNNLLNDNNGMKGVSHEVIQKMAPFVFKAYNDEFGDIFASYQETPSIFHRVITQTLLNDHVGAEGNLPYVEEFRESQGFKDAHNTDELVANLEKMNLKENQILNASSTVWYSKLLYDYEVMRTINAGVDIDVNRILNAIPGAVFPDLADKITQYVIDRNLFSAKEGENAEQTYDRCKELYITMSAKEAFTQNNNQQRKFESSLLDMLQQLPEERRIAEAFDLLSTHVDYKKAEQVVGNTVLGDDEVKEQVIIENLKAVGGSILQYDGNKQVAEKIYADYIIQKHGPDNQSQDYREKMNTELETIYKDISVSSRRRICKQVAKGVMAQKELAFDIKDIHDKETANNSVKGEVVRGYNLISSYLNYNPEFARTTMDFLLSNGSLKDCEEYSKALAHEYNRHRSSFPKELREKFDEKLRGRNIEWISSTDLQMLQIPDNSFIATVSKLHEEYLNASFEERSVIMHRLLDSYGKNSNTNNEQRLQKQISYVSDKVFGTQEKDKDLLEEVKIISTAVCHQEEQPSLLLGAVLAGREPGQADEKMNVGDGLTMFCEKKGTAWVKLAQTLSYVDALRQDIRDSLGRLKDKANEPTQWEIYKDLDEAIPNAIQKRIKKIKKFIGGGTFNKTILVEVENPKTGKSEAKVVQVMHDRAATKAKREFAKINKAIDELCSKDSKYEILRNVAERSAKNAKVEVDINKGAQQYTNACENYGEIGHIDLNGVTYIPKVATWEYYGSSKFSNYKIMEMAPGKSIDSPDFTPEQRREMALAYTIIEMTNLMGGKAWDIDRHSKQQNFYITEDKNGKKIVEIGVFDTGGQREAPTNNEKKMLGKLLISVVKEQLKGEKGNLSEFMLEKIKKFQRSGKDVNYISDVQRGLLALSDVMKYMNTPENPNGMVDGLKTCFEVLRTNKLIDETLYSALIKETIKTALTSPKQAMSALSLISHPAPSKDQISICLDKDSSKIKKQRNTSVKQDKPQEETNKIELEKTRIKPKPKTPKEKVVDTLRKWGIEDGSYMIITPEDNVYTEYHGANGLTARDCKGYFTDGAEEIQKNNTDVVYGSNNGLVGAYFAEGVYVVSANDALERALYNNGKNVGLGVILSNGEGFVYNNATPNTYRNEEWKKIKKAGQATGADKVSQTLEKLCEFGDKYDKSGALKEKLAQTYVSDTYTLTDVTFWGEIILQSEVSDQMKSEATKLGVHITKELKCNSSNRAYHAVKERCSSCKNAEEMLETARTCAERSHSQFTQNSVLTAAR